ncbi:MAG: helix-turn-helix domain-containing protein [Burkholderiales bacterium]
MPRKNLDPKSVPTLIQDRLHAWGLVIKKQRAIQRIRAADLSQRMEVSEATLRRLERGDAGAGAALYLTALHILGALDELAPMPPKALWNPDAKQRVRVPRKGIDDGYF